MRYASVYPGVDVVYYGRRRELEYDFHLAPGADASRVRLRFTGAERLSIERETGDLLLDVGGREVRQHKPFAYQSVGGGAVTTDSNGNFSFDNLPAGDDYSVTPSREFYDFSPSVGVFNDLGADAAVTFTATLRHFSVGGRVAEGGVVVAGVTVQLGGTRTATTQTDDAGNYVFPQLPSDGTYTVTPAASAVYAFTPGVTTFNTLRFDETASFAAARRLYQVSGYALDACGRAVTGVTMSLAHDAVAATAQTDAAGFYSFAGVQAGYNYALAPVGSAYAFGPPSYAFPGLSANQAANFTGRPPAATADVLPLADLYVRGGSAGSNFGAATQLIARLANQTKDTHESYLKFDVGQPCTVASVRLRLYGQLSASGNLPVAVYGVPATTWTETGTTWSNKPAAGAPLRTVSIPGTTAAWYEWDVTDYVRAEVAAGRSVVAFALKGASTTSYQVSFRSREATGTNAPRLSITTP